MSSAKALSSARPRAAPRFALSATAIPCASSLPSKSSRPRQAASFPSTARGHAMAKRNPRQAKKAVAQPEAAAVMSSEPIIPSADSAGQARQEKTMQLTLKGQDKRGRNAIYTGGAVSLRFPLGAFPDKTAPQTLSIDGIAGPKAPKVPETAEERKARLAARPKPTLAERAQKAEERAAKLREQLAKGEGGQATA